MPPPGAGDAAHGRGANARVRRAAPLPTQLRVPDADGREAVHRGDVVREVGPVLYVVKIAPDHLTITALAATEVEDGKAMTQEMILMADYHLTRDGTTLVGLITGVDATVGGELTDEQMPELQEELSLMQKGYTDKPFAMSVRVYGDALVIGNVRLPKIEDEKDAHTPLGIVGGRYRSANEKSLPKPKVMKPGGARSLPPGPAIDGPVGSYHPLPVDSPYGPPVGAPVPFAAPPSCPQPAPQIRFGPPPTLCPAPGLVPPALNSLPTDDRIPPPAPRVTEPRVPPMAVPTPPVIEEAKTERKLGAATELLVTWKTRIELLPDPTRNGEKGACLAGRVFTTPG